MPETDAEREARIKSENEVAEKLKNESKPVSSDPTALQEQLDKERKQRDLDTQRIRQLENEKKAREDADAETERKKLEDDGENAELARREKERADAAEKALADRDLQEALTKGTAEVFAKYPKNIQRVAQTAGLSLTADTEEAKTALAEKMDALAKDINGNTKVRGNNMPPENRQEDPDRALALKKLKFGDKSKENMHELLKDNPGIAGMKRLYENAQLDPNA